MEKSKLFFVSGGNILQILDSNGNIVVEYEYDAWGNHKVLNADGAEITDGAHIGNMNVLRYRGYIYDTVSGLYYLNARFYDPETGRFISMDDISYADVSTYNGLNLYAYCRNNPIMYFDPTGHIAWWGIVIGIIGLVMLATQDSPHKLVIDDTSNTDSLQLSSGKTVHYTFDKNLDDISKSRVRIYNSFQYSAKEQETILKAVEKEINNKFEGDPYFDFNIKKMKNEWGWHNFSYGMGFERSKTASVDLFINGDDVGHGPLSWIMNNICIFD